MVRSTATIDFLKYAPRPESGGAAIPVPATSFDQGNGTFLPISPPLPTLQPTVPLLDSPLYYPGETIYLRLTDLDQNLNPGIAETVLVTVSSTENGDAEVLRLTETGLDTGTFTGYLPTFLQGAPGADGQLLVANGCSLRAIYNDHLDQTDTSADTTLIDPYGVVFDSQSGQPLDGATVTLMNTLTDAPATVFGDDGASLYPATVTTGGTLTDASGKSYQLPAGGFRFPYILPGTYRLLVSPPVGFSVPSALSDSQLLTVRPDAVLAIGSRGEDFIVNPGPALRIDIPADQLSEYLWLQKVADDGQVSIGDFLQYRLKLENTSESVTAASVSISDRLPLGFRYQKGSVRIAGESAPEPVISADGRTVTFPVGDLPPKGTIEITYVTEVAAGAKTGEAINLARATARSGASSNLAKAKVEVQERFFLNSTFLMGRVLTGDCRQDDTEMLGVPGARLYLEDGSFVISDTGGRFHFEGVSPGTHVIQLDLDSIPAGYEAQPCQPDNRFAGRTFSQFVDLQAGTLWQTNFYIAPKPLPTGHIHFRLEATPAGETIVYRLPIESGEIGLANLQATVILPEGVQLIPDGIKIDGVASPMPQATGSTLILPLGSQPPGSRHLLEMSTLDTGDNSGELLAKAMLSFELPDQTAHRTPQAESRIFREAKQWQQQLPAIAFTSRYQSLDTELGEDDLIRLRGIAEGLADKRIIRIDAIGHTDNLPISRNSRKIYTDNLSLSEARATKVARALGEMLNLLPGQITITGRGDREPLSREKTAEARDLNRRVELIIVAEETSTELKYVNSSNGQSVEMPLTLRAPGLSEPPPEVTPAVESSAQPGFRQPKDGAVLAEQVMQVQILLDSRLQPRLLLDGKEISKERIGFIRTDAETGLTAYNYVGIDFGRAGLHVLVLEGIDPFGNVRFTATNRITRTGKIKRIQQIAGPDNVADGVTPVEIRLHIEDAGGETVSAPIKMQLIGGTLRPKVEKEEQPRDFDKMNHQLIEVDQNGVAKFAGVTQAGRHTATLAYDTIEIEVETWLKPAPRDWILVGFAEGTVGYNTISDNMVSAGEAGIEEDGYTDGRVKFFAKGAIRGDWLLTLAYDSDKPELDGDSLHQVIDPDTYYPLYGDETLQGYEAASARDIYVKLERDQFYLLFGDMQTGLTRTELSKYVRSMNGVKSELQSENFAFTVFAADTRQSFVKDEIRGDGTSGRYRLSEKELVINSEEIHIETRDRFHPERILNSDRLSRHVDYDIDYTNGTLYFKRPIPSKDEAFNPIFIVVRYETADATSANLNYGGRGGVKLLDRKLEVGGSLIHEENGAAEGDLYGADVTVNLTPQTALRGEVATTDSRKLDQSLRGDAYLAEIVHADHMLTGRAWFREQDAEFGLGQQNGGQSGMRTYGAEGAYRLTPQWSLAGEGYHEDNLATDARRDVAEMQAGYRADRYGLSFGVREARDRFATGETQRSSQVLAGGDVNVFNRLTLRASHEQSLGSSNESADFPTRTMLGADYRLSPKVSLFAVQEFTWGDREDTQGTRAGFKSTPWSGGTLSSAVERRMAENAERMFALFGLGQTWQVTRQWNVSFSLDRSHTLKHSGNDRINSDSPPASGSDEDFTSVSAGANYQAETWSWSNRLETRQADSEEKIGISSGLIGKLSEGVAASARLIAFFTDREDGADRDEKELTLGLAYRPDQSRWIILERLDLEIFEDENDDSWRIVNHLHANWRPSRQWQASGYYGFKYVQATFNGDRYDSFTDVLAGEIRTSIARHWDLGGHGALLHSWNSRQLEFSAGASVGYQAMTNAWVSLGYNFNGFEDDDFEPAGYTARGPFLRLRMKFDQQSVLEALRWFGAGGPKG